MLKIPFLVAFCGLLVQMTQAQQISRNCYPVSINPKIFALPVSQNVDPTYLVPQNPGDVADPTTGNTLSGVTLPEKPTVNVSVTTMPDGSLNVACNGQGKYKMDLKGSTSQKGVSCDMSTSIQVPVQIELTSEGILKCGKMPNKDDVKVQVKSKPILSGLLQTILTVVLNLVTSVLQILNNVVSGLIGVKVPIILDSIKNTLDGIFKNLSDPKDLGDGRTCKHRVMTKSTGENKFLQLVVESVLSASGEMPPPAPGGTYVPPAVVPVKDSLCTFALPEAFINSVLNNVKLVPYEVTENLGDLSIKVQGMCGKDLALRKLAFVASGSLQVKINQIGIKAYLNGKLTAYVGESKMPFIEATGSLIFSGKVDIKLPCIQLMGTIDGLGELKLVTGPSHCDVISEVSKTLIGELKARVGLSVCLGASPIHNLKLPVKTQCTNKEGHVAVDQLLY